MEAFVSLPVIHSEANRLKAKYQPHSKLEPHITLIPPGRLMVSPEEAKRAFSLVRSLGILVLKKTKEIGEFRQGEGGVFFIALEQSKQLEGLRASYIEELSSTVISNENVRQKFNAHLTIARYHTPEQRVEMQKQLSAERIPDEIEFYPAEMLTRQDKSEDWQVILKGSI